MLYLDIDNLKQKTSVPVPPGLYWLGSGEDVDIQVGHTSISRLHCQLRVTETGGRIVVEVRDRASLNGTFKNGHLLGKRPDDFNAEDALIWSLDESHCRWYELYEGDELSLGEAPVRISPRITTTHFVGLKGPVKAAPEFQCPVCILPPPGAALRLCAAHRNDHAAMLRGLERYARSGDRL